MSCNLWDMAEVSMTQGLWLLEMHSSALDSSCLVSSPRNKFYMWFLGHYLKTDIHLMTPRYLCFPRSFLCVANVYWIHSWCQAPCQVKEDRKTCQSIGDRVLKWGPVQSFPGLERKEAVSPVQKWGCPMEEELWQVGGSVKSPRQGPLSLLLSTLGSVELLESFFFYPTLRICYSYEMRALVFQISIAPVLKGE